jgi:hypothetical protein
MMVVASEVGVMDFEPGEIQGERPLQPGKILLVDTEKGRIYYDGELKASWHRIQNTGPTGSGWQRAASSSTRCAAAERWPTASRISPAAF